MNKIDYIFETLTHRKLSSKENKLIILAQSDEITFSKSVKWTYHEEILNFLLDKLNDNLDYYVIDYFRVYKGKTIVKSGDTVIASKKSIIDYVSKTYYSNGKLIENDVNPIVIMQKKKPQEVICIGYDGENGLIHYEKG